MTLAAKNMTSLILQAFRDKYHKIPETHTCRFTDFLTFSLSLFITNQYPLSNLIARIRLLYCRAKSSAPLKCIAGTFRFVNAHDDAVSFFTLD